MGVRTLDLRVSGEQDGSKSLEFWCSHTFMTVPLKKVLKHIKKFVDEFPSEVVVVEIHPDQHPLNGEFKVMQEKTHTVHLSKIHYPDIIK